MSKSQKKKVTVKTLPGEAVFVASVDVFNHIMETYIYMADSAATVEEAESWKSVVFQIDEWVKKTYHSDGDQIEEEW